MLSIAALRCLFVTLSAACLLSVYPLFSEGVQETLPASVTIPLEDEEECPAEVSLSSGRITTTRAGMFTGELAAPTESALAAFPVSARPGNTGRQTEAAIASLPSSTVSAHSTVPEPPKLAVPSPTGEGLHALPRPFRIGLDYSIHPPKRTHPPAFVNLWPVPEVSHGTFSVSMIEANLHGNTTARAELPEMQPPRYEAGFADTGSRVEASQAVAARQPRSLADLVSRIRDEPVVTPSMDLMEPAHLRKPSNRTDSHGTTPRMETPQIPEYVVTSRLEGIGPGTAVSRPQASGLHHTVAYSDDEIVEKIVSRLSLEEKVGQLFMVSIKYDKDGMRVLEARDQVRDFLASIRPGGVILYQENIHTVPQIRELIRRMQGISTVPLFIAIDEEGGYVSRLASSEYIHATRLPSQKEIGLTADPLLAYKAGEILGRELASLGINMNFAPVADLETNPQNRVIGLNERSFGPDPYLVADMVAASVEGMQSQDISAVLKHFPGHGDTVEDSHVDTVVLNHTLDRLQSLEFIPFRRGVQAGADGVMTVHVQMPLITGEDIPITFSSLFLDEILRQQIGHEKLIITDSLEMGAISRYWNGSEAVVNALRAGADIVLDPSTPRVAYETLIGLFRDGSISESRLDQSVRRIVSVKLKRGILDPTQHLADPEAVLGNAGHQAVVEEILRRASDHRRRAAGSASGTTQTARTP